MTENKKISIQKMSFISAVALGILALLTIFATLCVDNNRQRELIEQQSNLIMQQDSMINTYHIIMRTIENCVEEK